MRVKNNITPLPTFFVGKNITTNRINAYLSGKYPILNSALGKPDTQSIWYAKEHLEAILAEINYANGDGLRIHLGAYEESSEFAGQLCLLFNVTRSTIKNGQAIRQIVYLEDEPDFNERSVQTRGDLSTLQPLPKDFNYGSPCPPRCDPQGS